MTHNIVMIIFSWLAVVLLRQLAVYVLHAHPAKIQPPPE